MKTILFTAILVGSSLYSCAQDIGSGIPAPPPAQELHSDTTIFRCVMQSGEYNYANELHTFRYDIIPIDGPDIIPTHELALSLDKSQNPESFVRIFSMGMPYAVDSAESGPILIAWEKAYVDFKVYNDRIVNIKDAVSGTHIWEPNEQGLKPSFSVLPIHHEVIPQSVIGSPGEMRTYRGQYKEEFVLYAEDGNNQHSFQFLGVSIPQTNEGSDLLKIELEVMSDHDVNMLKNIFINGPPIPDGHYRIERQFFNFKVKDGFLMELSGLGSDWMWEPASGNSVPVVYLESYTSDGPTGR